MSTEAFDSWVVLELMGHVRMAGRVTEEELFGAKIGRIDVPKAQSSCPDCNGTGSVLPFESGSSVCPGCEGKGTLGGGFTTVFFGGASVYRLTPTTEAVARAVAKSSQPKPVHAWELPSPQKAAEAFSSRSGFDPPDDDDERDPDDSRDMGF
jgi:hypothetical protein